MKEEWKDIKGYEGKYQVSNYGRVKSMERIVQRSVKSAYKSHKYPVKEKILKQTVNRYPSVNLSDGSIERIRVHRLVAEAFIPNPENKPQVNHRDGDKTNNNIKNLEWVTCSENHKHAYDNGLRTVPSFKGEEHNNSKLTKFDVINIRKTYKRNGEITQAEIAEKYNVSESAINSVISKRSWKHI